MNRKTTSSFVFIILMVNLFFEMSVSYHLHFEARDNLSQQVSFELDHASDIFRNTQSSSNHCVNSLCHSGFCKFLNTNKFFIVVRRELVISYDLINAWPPESPFLFASRRPPKGLA